MPAIDCTTATIAESSIAGRYFKHLVEYALAVCKECRHGVLPSQIKNHVQHAHPTKRKQAKAIADKVGTWAGLIEYASELEVPSQVIEPVQQLPVYKDGLMCQLAPDRCRQIFRSKNVMKKHWQVAHEWSPAGKGRRPRQEQQKKIEDRIRKYCKTVHCQRLLVQGQGSQYFQVQQPSADGPETVPIDSNVAWAQVGEQIAKA